MELFKAKKFSPIVFILFLAVATLGVITSFGNAFAGDDFSYLAYLTNWQHAKALSFHNVIFAGSDLDAIRFWFAMFPMNLAFLAETSNLHGLLLLGYYLEPFLIVLSLLCFYNLFEDLFPSDYLPITATLLHFTFLFMLYGDRELGSIFFNRIAEDKVFAAFILFPVFLLAVRCLMEKITLKNGLFVLISGWSLALTHPIILAFSVMIAGFYICFLTIASKDYKKFVVAMIFLAVIILPSSSLRFVEVPWVSKYIFHVKSPLHQPGSFDLETALTSIDTDSIISYIPNTPFYGFNLERVKIPVGAANNPLTTFFSWSYLWMLGMSLTWALFNLRKNGAAALIAATCLLVLVGAIPYTGWLLGYLVSARMLWRIPWMFSAGPGIAVLLHELLAFLLQRSQRKMEQPFLSGRITLGLTFLISLITITWLSFSFYTDQWQRLATVDTRKKQLEMYVALGNKFEKELATDTTIFASRDFSDYLPGISSKPKVILFRSNRLLTPYPINTRYLGTLFSKDQSITIQQRIQVLHEYHIQYIMIKDNALKDYYAQSPKVFTIQQAGSFWILKFRLHRD